MTREPDLVQAIEMGDLLAGAVRGILQAQDQLDARAAKGSTQFVETPQETLTIPPLWFTVKNASVELEMSAVVSQSRLVCRLLNPQSVSLFGYQASAGTRVRLLIAPHGE